MPDRDTTPLDAADPEAGGHVIDLDRDEAVGNASAGDGSLQQPRRRHPSDLVRVVLALLVLVVASLPVRPDGIGRVEEGAFDLVNGLPDWLFWVLWAPMQLGSLMAVPIVAVPALLMKRRRLAIDATITGFAAWTLAKVVKDAFGRPRPGGLLETVAFKGGEPTGFGYVSGHTAVAFALATAAVLHLPRRWRPWAYALATLVGLSRIFVGAHLPLDVVGGAALGWAIGAAYRWAVGAPTGRPSIDLLRDRLGLLGLQVADVRPLPSAKAHTSAPYRLRTTDEDGFEEDWFVKVLSDRPMDRDRLHRAWLWVSRQQPEQRFPNPVLQATHEAAMALAAREAGVRTPRVRLAERFGGGSGVLVTRWVAGTLLTDVADLPDATIDDAFRQLADLHGAGHAHGSIGPDNLLLDGEHLTFLDFGDGHLAATDEQQRRDVVDLLVVLAERHDGVAVVRHASQWIGAERVADVLAEEHADERLDRLWSRIAAMHPTARPVDLEDVRG